MQPRAFARLSRFSAVPKTHSKALSQRSAGVRPNLGVNLDAEVVVVGPQEGPQETFLATPADIAIYGGAAGGGKTWALLFEGLRHKDNPEFGFVIFRRTSVQIRNQGGLWDESMKLYPLAGAAPREGTLDWFFPSGMWVGFAHMQYEQDKLQWQGSQLPAIGFDELTHFSETQFFYMLSRNRSMSGVAGYIRATTNPDPDSWVAEFIAWWIDQDENSPTYGLPIPERAGVLRWFVRINDQMAWADSAEELRRRFKHLPPEDVQPKSVTFIPAKLDDNPALMAADPGYRANLLAMSYVEREQLLGGNWKVRASAGKVFPRDAWRIVPAVPKGTIRWVRYWDKAGTEDDGDWSVGVLMGYHKELEHYFVKDVIRGQWGSAERNRIMRETAELDGHDVEIWVEQEPGSGGKESAETSVRLLRGFTVRVERVTLNKKQRADPMAAQQQVGNISLVRGEWVPAYIWELERFVTKGIPDDQVDASSGAFNKLSLTPQVGRSSQWITHRR
jgi:predicted phage terminase large subunit-like protein